MPVSGSDAVAQAPTLEQEMGKFKGFAVKDGEVFDGKGETIDAARAEAEAAEKNAAEVNGRSHAENQAAGKTSVEPPKPVELSAEEEQNALQDATDKKGAVLTDEEADAVVAKALAAKEKAATKPKPNPEAAKKAFERREARRRDSLARENEDLRRRLEALERGERPALTNDNKGDKKTSTGDKPDAADTAKYQYGELDPQYLADLARWEVRQELLEQEKGKQTQQQTAADAKAAEAFKERVSAFEEAGLDQFDDFHEVVISSMTLKPTDPGFWPLSAAMGEMILESDHGPAIAYELASDPKEARKISQLSLKQQAAWFVRKEDEISAGSATSTEHEADEGANKSQAEAGKKRQLPQPRTRQVQESRAPRPLPKLNGAGGNRMPSSATTDFAAFEALANGSKR